MSSLQSAQTDEPPYRSYKELERNHTRVQFSPAANRLFWPYNATFPTAVFVMKTPRSPKDIEPYFQPDTEGGDTDTWHEISQLPLTEPRVSCVEATISDLDQWESNWMAWHINHTGDQFNREYVTYGDLSDEDRPYTKDAKEDGSWEEDSDTEFLMKCCGQDRPLRKGGKTLLVTPSAGNQFVTVHDYISAVHPWLMSLRDDIFQAKLVTRPQPYFAWQEELMVSEGPEDEIQMMEDWLQERGVHRPFTERQIASNAAILARIRASRNR